MHVVLIVTRNFIMLNMNLNTEIGAVFTYMFKGK